MISHYLLCLLFYKNRIGGLNRFCWWGWGGWLALLGWGGGGEMGRRMNIVQIMCTHVFKCKNDTC
jgi:hypothetical protein